MRAAARRPRAAASAGAASRGEMLPTHRLPRSAELARPLPPCMCVPTQRTLVIEVLSHYMYAFEQMSMLLGTEARTPPQRLRPDSRDIQRFHERFRPIDGESPRRCDSRGLGREQQHRCREQQAHATSLRQGGNSHDRTLRGKSPTTPPACLLQSKLLGGLAALGFRLSERVGSYFSIKMIISGSTGARARQSPPGRRPPSGRSLSSQTAKGAGWSLSTCMSD